MRRAHCSDSQEYGSLFCALDQAIPDGLARPTGVPKMLKLSLVALFVLSLATLSVAASYMPVPAV
jgi:hypothetical protein